MENILKRLFCWLRSSGLILNPRPYFQSHNFGIIKFLIPVSRHLMKINNVSLKKWGSIFFPFSCGLIVNFAKIRGSAHQKKNYNFQFHSLIKFLEFFPIFKNFRETWKPGGFSKMGNQISELLNFPENHNLLVKI